MVIFRCVNGIVDPKYRFLIQAVYEHFRANAAWPLVRQLEIDLEDLLDPLGGLQQVCSAIGSDKIVCGSSYDANGVCRLRLAGFLECRGADDDVERFLGAVRCFAQKYRDAKGATVTMSAGEFVEALGYTEDQARRVGLMLLDASDLWTTATQPPNALPSFTPGPLARSMKAVASLDEFFAVIRQANDLARAAALGRTEARSARSPQTPKRPKPREYDVFIAYAYEDKRAVAHPLAEVLGESVEVWYDDFALKVGDSLRRSIDSGLANCRFGVVILSPAFFKKEWPQRELDGLAAREIGRKKVILPVWHGIDFEGVRAASPILADRVAAKTSEGISAVAAKLLDVITEREDDIVNHPAGAPSRDVDIAGNRVGFLNAITTLIDLKEAGTELLNEDLTRADQATFVNWLARMRLWEDGVVTALQAAGAPPAAISDFTTLITFQPVGPAISEEHARQKGMLAARLQRLRVIINDLDRDQRAESQLEKLRRIWPK